VDIKEYISSGIIESYVLGLASPEERSEFEQLCLVYPELAAARTEFEIALENRLMDLAVAPAEETKKKVMDSLRQQSSVNQTKIITMEKANTTRSSSSLRWVAAASVILLLGCVYLAYSFYSKNKKLESELTKTRDEQNKVKDQLKQLEMLTDPNVAVVNLKGTEKAPNTSASVYWDSTSASVYLVVKNMPQLPNDKQYQLWSIINGPGGQLQPSSMGLFDVGADGKIILKIDKGAKKADAFAITIEKRGNTGGPTLDSLQAMGKPNL